MAPLDQREGARSTAEPARRRIVSIAPADVWRLDEPVDEQDERARDRQRPGGVVASPRREARLSRRSRGESASAARPRGC